MIAIDKPPGIATSGRTLDDEGCVQGRLMRAAGTMVWAVHQLDKTTSGVNLFARAKRDVDWIRRRMTGPDSAKVYLALVHGEPAFDRLLVDAPIGTIEPARRVLGVVPGDAAARPSDARDARTALRVVARVGGFALVAARLLTGRTHQVRIHLAHLGHPLVGERFYREPRCELAPRQALHAARVVLSGVGSPDRVEAPFPEDLRQVAARLGFAREALAAPADA